jgi:putative ABC transport system substrate-binding protein
VGRREFIALLSGAAGWPLATSSQGATRIRKIGVLFALAAGDPEVEIDVRIFQQHLKEFGWEDGKTVELVYYWSGGDANRIRANAADLVGAAPDVILATSTPTLRAILEQTRTIPVVFVNVADPVAIGAVEQLSKPGGNATGFTLFEATMGGKWLELLKDVRPGIRLIAAIFNPETGVPIQYLRSVEASAASFSVKVLALPIRHPAEIAPSIIGHGGNREMGMIVLPDPFAVWHRDLIVSSINRSGVTSVYPFRQFAVIGGLMSYGVDLRDQYRQAALYVDRVLKGADIRELPVQAPNKFELVINLKTARALGLEIPPSLLARADEVIE